MTFLVDIETELEALESLLLLGTPPSEVFTPDFMRRMTEELNVVYPVGLPKLDPRNWLRWESALWCRRRITPLLCGYVRLVNEHRMRDEHPFPMDLFAVELNSVFWNLTGHMILEKERGRPDYRFPLGVPAYAPTAQAAFATLDTHDPGGPHVDMYKAVQYSTQGPLTAEKIRAGARAIDDHLRALDRNPVKLPKLR